MNEYVPSEFYLGQNYPNPFQEKTMIKYCVPYRTRVKITIYDSEGKMIKKLVDKVKEAGTYKVEFSAEAGNIVSANGKTYYYCLETGNFSNTKRMTSNKNLFKEL